jgi:hypothetical protein
MDRKRLARQLQPSPFGAREEVTVDPEQIAAGVRDLQAAAAYRAVAESKIEHRLSVPEPPHVASYAAVEEAKRDALRPPHVERSVSLKPQRWNVAGGRPEQLWGPRPGLDSGVISNTGANAMQVAPRPDLLVNGRGFTVAAGGTFTLECQDGVWAVSALGTTVDMAWLWYETSSDPTESRSENRPAS